MLLSTGLQVASRSRCHQRSTAAVLNRMPCMGRWQQPAELAQSITQEEIKSAGDLETGRQPHQGSSWQLGLSCPAAAAWQALTEACQPAWPAMRSLASVTAACGACQHLL